jgi:hypothetical protein
MRGTNATATDWSVYDGYPDYAACKAAYDSAMDREQKKQAAEGEAKWTTYACIPSHLDPREKR